MNVKKRRTRRRIAGLALAVILVSGCSLPEIPDGASWDTEIAVPLAQKTYALWEIADADSVIDAEGSGIGMTLPDSALYFSYYKDLEPIYPARSLRYDPIEHEIEARARGLRIPLDVEESRDLSLSVLNPTLANRHGTVTNVSPFAISVILQLAVSELFTAACVDSGDVQIRFRNTLPFAISAARLAWYADRVSEVRLYQGTLDAVQDTSYTMDLGGTCLAPTMTLEITGMAIGGQQVFIDSAQGLIVEIVMNDFIAATYTGIVPRQTMEADSSYPLEQQHDIFDADISEGELTITLTNNTPLVDSVRVLLPNLRIESGLPLTVTEALLPGQTREVRVNLAGFGFVVPEPARQEIDGWVESASIEMDHSVTYGGENLRTTARFRTSELRFRRFEGVVHDLETDIERDSSEVEDVPDGWENVHPAALDMRLDLTTAVPAMGRLSFDMYSLQNGAALGSESRMTDLWLGNDTTLLFTGLTGLVPGIPDWIGHTGRVVVDGPITIRDTDVIGGRIELHAPLLFTVDETHIPGDVERVELDAMEDVQQVTLSLRLWNGLPVHGTLRLIAAFDSLAALESSGLPAETLCVVALPPAVMSGGRVAEPGYTEIEIEPPPGSYDFLRDPPFFLRSELFLEGTNGDTLTAYGSDEVRFSATARVRYRVKWEG